MILPKSFTTVTSFSKALAGFLFIIFPLIGFIIGREYQKTVSVIQLSDQEVISKTFISSAPSAPRKGETKKILNSRIKLIYPRENSIIGENTPTIMGQIRQPIKLLLAHEFKQDNFVHYNADEIDYGISFEPGELINVVVMLDEKIQELVHGFPQYPYIICSQKDTDIPTSDSCIEEHIEDIPPVLFFIKPQTPLTVGIHTVSIQVDTERYEYQFTVNPNVSIPKQDLPKQVTDQYLKQKFTFLQKFFHSLIKTVYAGHDNPARNNIDRQLGDSVNQENQFFKFSDYCPAGYHYPENWLPIPLPSTKNENIYYELYLPIQSGDFGLKPNRKVNITFEEYIYDLKLTDYSNFYSAEFTVGGSSYIDARKSLYIPMEHLTFEQSGESIDVYLTDDEEFPVAFNYLEYFPHDYANQNYKQNLLLFRTINSSSCDG